MDEFLQHDFERRGSAFSKLELPGLRRLAVPIGVELQGGRLAGARERLQRAKESSTQELQREELRFQLLKMEHGEAV